VQLLAAVPMPMQGSREEASFASVVKGLINRRLDPTRSPAAMGADAARGMASSFLQLAYPWARTPGSSALPEGLEGPDAVLAGVLARNALTRGTFRSAGGSPLADVLDVVPLLRPDHLRATELSSAERLASAFEERVTVLGWSPSGLRLLSDVTASGSESYRPASVHRLVSVIARAARRLGNELTFDASGEMLWARVREALNDLLTGLFQSGALRGASPAEAFHVRCDRTTMTQTDIDAGRLIAEVRFDAAAPIERIRVLLSLDDAGQLSLRMAGVLQEAA
jgi:phage tail sheath protein FI